MKNKTQSYRMPAIVLTMVSVVLLCLSNPVHASVLYSNAGPLSVAGDGVTVVSNILNGTNISYDTNSSGTVYVSYTVIDPPGPFDSGYFTSGLQLAETNAAAETDTEALFVGKTFYDWVYGAGAPSLYNSTNYNSSDIYLNSATPEPGETYQYVRDSDVTTIIFQVQFNAGTTNDAVTIWLNPDLSMQASDQSTNLTTSFVNDCNFNEIELLNINFDDGTTSGGPGSGVWTYYDVVVGTSPTDVGFPPTPSVQISAASNGVTISWTGSGTLQQAPGVSGPWTASSDQSNPQTRTATGNAMFFRLQL
jgi:hypothetical protein